MKKTNTTIEAKVHKVAAVFVMSLVALFWVIFSFIFLPYAMPMPLVVFVALVPPVGFIYIYRGRRRDYEVEQEHYRGER